MVADISLLCKLVGAAVPFDDEMEEDCWVLEGVGAMDVADEDELLATGRESEPESLPPPPQATVSRLNTSSDC